MKFLFSFFLFFFNISFAQENVLSFLKEELNEVQASELTEGFYLINTNEIRKWCNITGATLVKNFDNNFYIIHSIQDISVLDIVGARYYEVTNKWKLSESIHKQGIFVESPENKVMVSVHVLNRAFFIKSWLRKSPDSIIKEGYKNYFIIEMPIADLKELMEDENTTHINPYKKPSIESPNIDSDLSVNTINKVHKRYPNLNGEGVIVSVKEFSFDPVDIDFKNRYFLTGSEAEEVDFHASLIATAIGGGGNSSGRSKGVANAVMLTSSSFLNIFPDAEEQFSSNAISVQNHSYGTSIESEYGNEAAAYDEISNALPQLLHVFSSGNSGDRTSEEGIYSGVPNFANQTGNFKGAKNIITVGSVGRTGVIDDRSSRGPAYDGRVKPELVSYAPGGTSDAAALVSGVAVLVQQAYMNLNSGILPPSSLVKSVLIGGSDDVGLPGIDFESGYGNLNAEQSIDIILEDRFFIDSVAQNVSKSFNIIVPPNTGLVKIALNWNDPAANSGDVRALVNDLDMVVIDATSNNWLPWVLDSSPSIASITARARRMEDHLNNTEFITLENPPSGNYTITIKGTEVIEREQPFSIAYDFIEQNNFTWIFPTSNDPVVVEDLLSTLRWKSTMPNETGVIEINWNNEGWNLLSDNVDLESGFFEFLTEENTAGTAQLRMIIGNQIHISETFTFSKELIPKVLFNCEEELLFGWESIPNATAYNIRFLDERYMEIAQTVIDTTALIVKRDFSETIFSVEPVFNELRGVQGRALDYQLQEVACYYIGFSVNLIDQGVVNTSLNLSTLINVQEVVFEKIFNDETSIIGRFVSPFKEDLILDLDDLNANAGMNGYRAVIILNDGTRIITDSIEVLIPAENTLILFPNPVSAGKNLNIISVGNQTDFEIVDFSGKVLTRGRIENITSNTTIELPIGLYILRVLDRGKTKVAKKFYVN